MHMAGRLQGKVCIVTGSGSAIGRASALMFAREGARVVGADIAPGAGQAVLDEVRAAGGNMVSLHPCKLTNPNRCNDLVKFALDHYGRLDVLFNNGARTQFAWIADLTLDRLQSTIAEELSIVFALCTAAWSSLATYHGVIINTASTADGTTFRALGGIAHCAAKSGVIAMTRQLAMEGRHLGIRANSISPGTIGTPAVKAHMSNAEWAKAMLDKIMLGRLGEPEEIAAVALFLASDESSFVNGADIIADGGATASGATQFTWMPGLAQEFEEANYSARRTDNLTFSR
jgi:NAD(P)-dependent dehydrogenase (short-subunit alcohol dehydrogenase family)